MKILVPTITPFDKNLRIDYNAIDLLMEYLRDTSLVVNSWIGEVYSLSPKEYISILSSVRDRIDKELAVYIPSYKYHVNELIKELQSFYGKIEIDDDIIIELDSSDWLCNTDICLSRSISITLNSLTSNNVMLYITGQYDNELIETIRGLLKIYPEITHIIVDHSISLSHLTRVIHVLDDIDRKVKLLVFGDSGHIVKNHLVEGIISPIELVKNIIENKYNVIIDKILFLSRITYYSYNIIGALKTSVNLIEPAIKEYTRPPIPTEFPSVREYIKSIINSLLKQVKT